MSQTLHGVVDWGINVGGIYGSFMGRVCVFFLQKKKCTGGST